VNGRSRGGGGVAAARRRGDAGMLDAHGDRAAFGTAVSAAVAHHGRTDRQAADR
jgi:hypothetical protein